MALLVSMGVVSLAVPCLTGLWVRRDLEKRLRIKISGRYSPAYFLPSFWIHNARIKWQDKGELVGGNLRVDYNLFQVLAGQRLRVRLSGEKLPIRLYQDWAVFGKADEMTLDEFQADLVFDREGLEEVSSIVAESPTFHFRFGEAEDQTAGSGTIKGHHS